MRRIVGYLFVIILPILAAAYAAESYLWYLGSKSLEVISKKSGHKYDPRSKLEVVQDLRKSGKNAAPYVPPETLFRPGRNGLDSALLGKDGQSMLSLGGISKTINVVCNEGGAWFSYMADRYGFNNPNHVWDSDHVDILTLGDSFTLGNCAPQGMSMVDLLRRQTDVLVNLGGGGNGPLFMLAALREYGAALRPKTVLWFFYNNDIENLNNEARNATLKRYLAENDFSQSLKKRQPEIDSGLSDLIDDLSKQTNWRERTFFRILRLQNLRYRLFPPPQATGQKGQSLDVEYGRILSIARETVSSWGGKIVFVYLPFPPRFFAPDAQAVQAASNRKETILSMAKKVGVETIDLGPKFDSFSDPGELAYAASTHYSEAGYRLAANAIAKKLGLKNR
ncbi:MAG: hypothetical protein CMM52_17755 [Rhodospirillaceae bacterium]|nr:hypothetical protein [Rhodospirillaceae bacterium]|tara:strand:+ start:46305 stop:47486 length:1182 start_codon:yes stop_codon:yes gene_type:complete